MTDNSLDRNGFPSDVLTDIPPDAPARRDDSASRKTMAFIDLAQQRRRLGDRIDRAIQRVLEQAVVPQKPVKPNRPKLLAFGASPRGPPTSLLAMT